MDDRTYLAGCALTGILAGAPRIDHAENQEHGQPDVSWSESCRTARIIADTLLKELAVTELATPPHYSKLTKAEQSFESAGRG